MQSIKFGKYFAEFMIPIALLMKCGRTEFVTIIEDSNSGGRISERVSLTYFILTGRLMLLLIVN